MVVEFPPQHVAERAYFRQANVATATACGPPNVALMFPDLSDSWFSPFKVAFEQRVAAEPRLRGLAPADKLYQGPASLRSVPQYASLLREIAIAALGDMRGTPGASDDTFDEVTQARLSGPSRIGFRVPYFEPDKAALCGASGRRFEIPLELDALTDWRHLDLSVVRRAESAVPEPFATEKEPASLSTDTARGLLYLGIRKSSVAPTAAHRLADIVNGLAPPGQYETSIELPFRLFLSPYRQGHFLTPRPSMRRPGPIPLWTAELDWSNPIERRGVGEVRAIWSPDLRKSVFVDRNAKLPPHGPFAPWEFGPNDDSVAGKSPFRTALDVRDRHEIVILSSVHGLPVLARPGEDGKLTGDQLAPPREFLLNDIDTQLTEGADTDSPRGQAIYDPQPLGVRELALSSLGGNLDLEAMFEPPYAAKLKGGDSLFPSLSVERWRQRTVLGRDVLVEVVYKGFLFPTGHRCTLVKLTERVFAANPAGGYPTAYLRQRQFLRISKPEKEYPAIGQPFAGRAWPPRLVSIVTRRTPDLVDPSYGGSDGGEAELAGFAVTPNGRLLVDKVGELKGLVFWPRTSACRGAEVKFEVRIDGAADSIFMPLLFLDNTAVADPTVVSEVVRYYNALDPDPTNLTSSESTKARWNQGGAIRRYAIETKSGEASLLSLQWIVGAEGGSRPGAWTALEPSELDELADQNNDYGITPVMNAADQPAFYPRLRAATVRLQSFERLVGHQVPPVTARYLPRYLRNDFQSENDTFMLLQRGTDKSITLMFSGENKDTPASGDRGGGVGQPNLTVDAISRKVGPTLLPRPETGVRHAELPRFPRIRLASADPRVAQFVAQGSMAGPGALPSVLQNATILGLPLLDLVGAIPMDDHPKLRETLDFAGALDDTSAEIVKKLRDLLADFNEELNKKANGISIGALLPLYPDLADSKRELEQAIASPGQAEAVLITAVEPARRLVAALYRAAADPLAPVREAARDAFRNLLVELLVPPGPAAFPAAISELRSGLKRTVCDVLKSPNLIVWRRLDLRLPAVRPDLASDLSNVDTAIDEIWSEAVDEACKQAESAKDLPGLALKGFKTRFAEEIRRRRQDLGNRASAAVAAELDRLERSANALADGTVTQQAAGALARQFASNLGTLETLAGSLDTSMLRDPEQLLARMGDLGRAILAVAVAEIPRIASSEIAKVCQTATDALALQTVAAIPTAASRDSLGKARSTLMSASDELKRRLRGFETAIRLPAPGTDQQTPWPKDAQQLLQAWVERQRNNAGALVQRLGSALQKLLDVTDAIAPSDFVSRACKDPKTAPFALLQDLDDARRQVIEAVRDVQRDFHERITQGSLTLDPFDFAGLKAAVKERLANIPNAPPMVPADELRKSLDDAGAPLQPVLASTLKLLADASVDAIDAATVLGAFAQGPDAVQAEAIVRVRLLLRTLEASVEPSRELAESLQQAIAFFDPVALQAEREALAKAAQEVTSAAENVEQKAESLELKVNAIVARHLEASEAALQQARAVLFAGADEVARTIIASLAPWLGHALDAIEQIDRQIISARADVIVRLEKMDTQASSASANFALAKLLRIVPGADTVRPLACPFFVTAAGCSVGIADDVAKVRDNVAIEADTVRALKDQLEHRSDSATVDSATVDALQDLVSRWRNNGPAAVQMVRRLFTFVQDILRGDLGRFIDLAGMAAKIEQELKSVLPLHSNLEHTLGLEIKPPGSLKDVFIVDHAPHTKDLDIKTTSKIDLLDRKPVEVTTTGKLRPFRVKLLGNTLDVATLKFSGATFTSKNGGPPDFRIAFVSFEPGKAIEFLEPLQRFLSPGDSGPRIQPLSWAPGVAAGYGLNLGIISIGTVSFANVILNAVAELPFTAARAKFRVGLGRRDAPFLISAFPYTGGGYFAITSTGTNIEGFEASFEYGGGGAFRFGPLSGQGRLTTGIFIRQSGEGAYMDGFFYCGGSARIAFFGVGASLTVRMSLVDGSMAGEAVFEFVFSLGIKDFKYQVPVWRRQGKGFTQSASLKVVPTTQHAFLDVSPLTGKVPYTLLAMRQPIRLAALTATDADAGMNACRPVPGAFFTTSKTPGEPFACMISTAMCQSQDWSTYASYFDSSLLDGTSAP
jgi:hypothetical protein